MLSVFVSNDNPGVSNVMAVIGGVVMVKSGRHDIYGKEREAFKPAATV